MDEVLPELIITWDQTGLNYVPVSSWTMAEEGCKRVEIDGKDDKRQITAVFVVPWLETSFPHNLFIKERPPGAYLSLISLQIGV